MDHHDESPLHRLVSTDDYYSQFQAQLEDTNERNSMGCTLLHVAAQSSLDNSRIVQLLLHRGADVNATTPDGHTPLHFAVSIRNRDAVVALIEAGASVNSKDTLGRTALHFSVHKGQSYPPSPVISTVGDMWIVKKLACHPEIDLNPVDHAGDTPLMWAVKERYLEAVKYLLNIGADPNVANQDKRTPLHEAFPCEDIVSALLSKGAGIYCEDKHGNTPVDVLVVNVRAHETVQFGKDVVWSIALRYRVTESLKLKLEEIPVLSEHLEKCCREVKMMMSRVIYDKFTLHDFALDCSQPWPPHTKRDILTAVVDLLEELYSGGSYKEYLSFIVERFFDSGRRSR